MKIITSEDKVLRNIHQLILHSMGEDRAFARIMFNSADADLVPAIRRCLQAARRDGDTVPGADEMKDGDWLVQHLLLMAAFMHLPGKALANYRAAPRQRVREVVLFALRGIGIREEAIQRTYSPKAVKAFASLGANGVSEK